MTALGSILATLGALSASLGPLLAALGSLLAALGALMAALGPLLGRSWNVKSDLKALSCQKCTMFTKTCKTNEKQQYLLL